MNKNDLSITARNLFKKTRVTTSRFSYNYQGTSLYVDDFQSGLGNWNITGGNWSIANGVLNDTSSTTTFNPPTIDSMFLTGAVIDSNSYFGSANIATLASGATGSAASTAWGGIYLYYQDDNNFALLTAVNVEIYNTNVGYVGYYYVTQFYVFMMVNGNLSQIGIGGGTGQLGPYASEFTAPPLFYPIEFVLHDWTTIDIIFGNPSLNTNVLSEFNTIAAFSTITIPSSWSRGSVGFGNGHSGNAGRGKLYLTNFKLIKGGRYQDIKSITSSLAAKAGVFDTVFDNDISGIDSTWLTNGSLIDGSASLSAGETIMCPTQYSDFELRFTTQVDLSSGGQFNINFHSQAYSLTPNVYHLQVVQDASNVLRIFLYFNNYLMGMTTPSNQTSFDVNGDLSKPHDFILQVNGQITRLFMDGNMVFGWSDTVTGGGMQFTTGYFGFSSVTGTLHLSNVSVPSVFKPYDSFSVNSGDTIDQSISNITQSMQLWVASDLLGRMRVKALSPTETPNYTYTGDVLITQTTDNSDKEYVNQVTVIGQGVSATAQDLASISSTGMVRESVVVDYTITTVADAQNRANQELQSQSRFNFQSDPVHMLNPGSELLDVVAVDVSDSDTNYNMRIYNQTETVDGAKSQNTIELGGGKI